MIRMTHNLPDWTVAVDSPCGFEVDFSAIVWTVVEFPGDGLPSLFYI